jgi:hypothetical protein
MAKQTFTTGQVLTAAQVNSLQTNDFNQTVSVKTAAYTLVAADKGTRIEFNTSGSVTCTVNTGLFDAGDTLIIQNRGAGAVTITAGTATVNTSATLVLSQYDAGTLYFVSDSAAIFFNTDAGGGSPLTTKGDIYVYGTSDTRLPVGANGYTIVADSSTSTGLKWAVDPVADVVTTAGDILYATAADTITRLGIGTAGQVLKVNSGATAPEWGAASAGGFVGCKVTKSATQTCPNDTDVVISWNTEDFDTDSFHDNSTNNSRITIPSGKGGKYLFVLNIGFAANSSGMREVQFVKNAAANAGYLRLSASASGSFAATLTSIVNLVATDYMEVHVKQNSGGDLNFNSSNTFFAVYYLGA